MARTCPECGRHQCSSLRIERDGVLEFRPEGERGPCPNKPGRGPYTAEQCREALQAFIDGKQTLHVPAQDSDPDLVLAWLISAHFAPDVQVGGPGMTVDETLAHYGMRAFGDVMKERARQVQQEGWTPEHDDRHDDDQLARAAACYAMPEDHRDYGPEGLETMDPYAWPWDGGWWKPTPDDRRRELVKAGALILAEIERLDRHTEVLPSTSGGHGHGDADGSGDGSGSPGPVRSGWAGPALSHLPPVGLPELPRVELGRVQARIESEVREVYEEPSLVWDRPRMWLGAQPRAYALEEDRGLPEGCEGVVCLNGGLRPITGDRERRVPVQALCYPFADQEGKCPSVGDTLRVVESIRMFFGDSPLLWHCTAGINRSSYMLAAYLIRFAGVGAAEVTLHLRKLRGDIVLFNRSFVEGLERFELAVQKGRTIIADPVPHGLHVGFAGGTVSDVTEPPEVPWTPDDGRVWHEHDGVEMPDGLDPDAVVRVVVRCERTGQSMRSHPDETRRASQWVWTWALDHQPETHIVAWAYYHFDDEQDQEE